MSIMRLYSGLSPTQKANLHQEILELGLLNSLNPARHRLTLYKLARKRKGATQRIFAALLTISATDRETFYDRICGLDTPPEGFTDDTSRISSDTETPN